MVLLLLFEPITIHCLRNQKVPRALQGRKESTFRLRQKNSSDGVTNCSSRQTHSFDIFQLHDYMGGFTLAYCVLIHHKRGDK